MTTAMRACKRSAAIASISAWRFVPLPESSTPKARRSGIVLAEGETARAADDRADATGSRSPSPEVREHAVGLCCGHHQHEPDAVVERTIHLRARHVSEPLDQPEDRWDAPRPAPNERAAPFGQDARK